MNTEEQKVIDWLKKNIEGESYDMAKVLTECGIEVSIYKADEIGDSLENKGIVTYSKGKQVTQYGYIALLSNNS